MSVERYRSDWWKWSSPRHSLKVMVRCGDRHREVWGFQLVLVHLHSTSCSSSCLRRCWPAVAPRPSSGTWLRTCGQNLPRAQPHQLHFVAAWGQRVHGSSERQTGDCAAPAPHSGLPFPAPPTAVWGLLLVPNPSPYDILTAVLLPRLSSDWQLLVLKVAPGERKFQGGNLELVLLSD